MRTQAEVTVTRTAPIAAEVQVQHPELCELHDRAKQQRAARIARNRKDHEERDWH